jgi:hypothetical protein
VPAKRKEDVMNETKLNGKAQHKHTCKDCHFLGHTVVGKRHFDMYVCLGKSFTYVARWGNREESYHSYPVAQVVAKCVIDETP